MNYTSYAPMIYKDRLIGRHVVECQNCGIEIVLDKEEKESIEIYNALPRPSPPVATVSALKTKDEIRELAKICAPDDGTWFGTAQDLFVNGYFHGRKGASRLPSSNEDAEQEICGSSW